jgi:hypothetical protein
VSELIFEPLIESIRQKGGKIQVRPAWQLWAGGRVSKAYGVSTLACPAVAVALQLQACWALHQRGCRITCLC